MSIESAGSYDVAVVGAGVAGLMLTRKLAEIGLNTALIERSDQLAGGPSTRNEGWLHRGTYHATSISERNSAIQVARRCIYGHEQIKSFAPEAIEDIDRLSYATTRDPDRIAEITSRWDEAGVYYKQIGPKELQAREPNVNIKGIAGAFEVGDLGINTRLLYRKLLQSGLRAGATIFPGAEVEFSAPAEAQITVEGDTKSLDARLFIHTAGYGVRELIEANFGVKMPLRYWKSHLMITSRLTQSAVFCLDPEEAALMNHGIRSLVGLNEDAVQTDGPDYDLIDENTERLRKATEKSFVKTTDDGVFVACIKTDIIEKTEAARSLSISVSEPVPNHLCVLPGKMTEAPFVTDVVTNLVYNRMEDDMIALRPMDTIK